MLFKMIMQFKVIDDYIQRPYNSEIKQCKYDILMAVKKLFSFLHGWLGFGLAVAIYTVQQQILPEDTNKANACKNPGRLD